MPSPFELRWEGRWEQLKGRVKERWGELLDDGDEIAEGQYDQLIDRLKERTGQSAEDIQRILDDEDA